MATLFLMGPRTIPIWPLGTWIRLIVVSVDKYPNQVLRKPTNVSFNPQPRHMKFGPWTETGMGHGGLFCAGGSAWRLTVTSGQLTATPESSHRRMKTAAFKA